MIAQYRRTIPNRVKSCREIDNLSIFAQGYVANVLTEKMARNKTSKRENIDNLRLKNWETQEND
jgi:hypothetical protein